MKYNRWYSSIGKILVFLFFCLFAVAIILPLVWLLIFFYKLYGCVYPVLTTIRSFCLHRGHFQIKYIGKIMHML